MKAGMKVGSIAFRNTCDYIKFITLHIPPYYSYRARHKNKPQTNHIRFSS